MILATADSIARLPACTVRRVNVPVDCNDLEQLHHFRMPVQDRESGLMTHLYFRIENLKQYGIQDLIRDKIALSEIANAVYYLSFTAVDVMQAPGLSQYVPHGSKKGWAERAITNVQNYLRHVNTPTSLRSTSVVDPEIRQLYLHLPGNVVFFGMNKEVKNFQGILNFFDMRFYFRFNRDEENILPYVTEKALLDAFSKTMKDAFGFMEYLGGDETKYPWNAELHFTPGTLENWKKLPNE